MSLQVARRGGLRKITKVLNKSRGFNTHDNRYKRSAAVGRDKNLAQCEQIYFASLYCFQTILRPKKAHGTHSLCWCCRSCFVWCYVVLCVGNKSPDSVRAVAAASLDVVALEMPRSQKSNYPALDPCTSPPRDLAHKRSPNPATKRFGGKRRVTAVDYDMFS